MTEQTTETHRRYLSRDFWAQENVKYLEPHFRLERCARIVNRLAHGTQVDLLDVGCGPGGTLARFLDKNVSYYGLDIALRAPGPNLRQVDIARERIDFDGRKFDVVVAAGVFEYLGGLQSQKLAEIRSVLRQGGTFVLTFSNFGHLHAIPDYYPFNNVQSIREFKQDLRRFFHIAGCFPGSHNWMFSEPRRRWLKALQMNLNFNIPLASPLFAISYIFVCH